MNKVKWFLSAVWNSYRRPYLISDTVTGLAIAVIAIALHTKLDFGFWQGVFYGFCSALFFGRVSHAIIEIALERKREDHFKKWMQSTLTDHFEQMFASRGMEGSVSFGPITRFDGPPEPIKPDAKKLN